MMLEQVCQEWGIPIYCMQGFSDSFPHASLAQQAVCFVFRARKYGFVIHLPSVIQRFGISCSIYLRTRATLHSWIKTDPRLSLAAFRQSLLRIFLHCQQRISVDPWINRLCAETLHAIKQVEPCVWQTFLSVYGLLWSTFRAHKSPDASRVHILRILMLHLNLPLSVIGPYFHPFPDQKKNILP
ncbi:hypothetical protein WKT22_02203 [Candidatus Lokiarchaeum ossiferum]